MKKGITLIEVVIAIAIFAVLIFGVAVMLNDIFVNSNQQLLSMSNIDQARMSLSVFTNEIRNAVAGSDGSYPLNQAGDHQIIFYSNFGTADGRVARIRYYVLNDTLYKGVVLPSGIPLTYDLSSESIKPVISGISITDSPAFYYYDGDYDGAANSILQPVNINQVRYVKISLAVLNKIKPQDASTFLISAGGAIRSVKDNLGD